MNVWDEEWHVWSYEGPNNDPIRTYKGKHGASVCNRSVGDYAPGRDEGHECLMTACADTEEHALRRAHLAAAAPEMCRLLTRVLGLGAEDIDFNAIIMALVDMHPRIEAALKKARGE